MGNPVQNYALIITPQGEPASGPDAGGTPDASRALAGFEQKGFETHWASLATFDLLANMLEGKMDQNDRLVIYLGAPDPVRPADDEPRLAEKASRLSALLRIPSGGNAALIVRQASRFADMTGVAPAVRHVQTQEEIDAVVSRLRPNQVAFLNFSPSWCDGCKPYQVDYALQGAQGGDEAVFLQTENADLAQEKYNLSAFPAVVRLNHQGEIYYITRDQSILKESREVGLRIPPEALFENILRQFENPRRYIQLMGLSAAVDGIKRGTFNKKQKEHLLDSIEELAESDPVEDVRKVAEKFLKTLD
ncbi:MAG: hypothetical protein Q7T11_04360 [Deltaproteobacteria bacterium]|nr:hypothetical protein [Deltaproteobacteria bacterium]